MIIENVLTNAVFGCKLSSEPILPNTWHGYCERKKRMNYKNYTYKIYPCSPQAKEHIESYEDTKGTFAQKRGPNTFPWNQMKIGESFIIGFERIPLPQLKNMVAVKPFRTDGKKFKIITHNEHKIYEVARIK